MRRRPSDRIEHVKPVGDLPVTGADQIEISDPAGRDIAGSRSRQTSLSDDKVVPVTRRKKMRETCTEVRDCS